MDVFNRVYTYTKGRTFFFLKVFCQVGGKIHVTNFEVGNRSEKKNIRPPRI